MRYPRHEERVNVLLDLARAAYRAEERFEGAEATNFIQYIDGFAAEFAWCFIDIIMEYEAKERRRGQKDRLLMP